MISAGVRPQEVPGGQELHRGGALHRRPGGPQGGHRDALQGEGEDLHWGT